MSRFWLSILILAVPLSAGAQSQLGETPPKVAPARPGAAAAAPAKPPARKVPVVQPPKTARPPAHHAAPPAAPKPAAPPEPAPAPAPPPPDVQTKGSVTSLPLPRFAALRSDDVNLRAGPGTRYQIDWVYHRRDLPVEIQREFDAWRLVSDMDGVKGWVHQATLIGRRTFMTKGSDQTLRRTAADSAPAVAVLKPGVIGRILACAAGAEWCEVQTGDYRGFLPRSGFWGTYPGEAVGN